MSKHTHQKWYIEIDHATGKPEFIRAFIADEHGGEMYDIANLGCDETGNATANARLIAAAPDLLRALICAEDALHAYSGGEASELERIRDAISKATGETA